MDCGQPEDDKVHVGAAASPPAEDAENDDAAIAQLDGILDELLATFGVPDSDNPHTKDRQPRCTPAAAKLLQQADDIVDRLMATRHIPDAAGQAKAQLERGQVLAERALLAADDRQAFDSYIDFVLEASDLEVAAKTPPNLAPYKIVTRDGQLVVVNNSGEVKAKFGKDKAAALKYLRALYANVKGSSGAAARKPWSGKQKRAS